MVNNSWNLIDLQVFCQVAKRGSFVAAATELGISPAYVTKRISGLEQALGVTLFHRTTRRVAISEAGEAAYAWARRVLDTAGEWKELAGAAEDKLTGTLRIATSLRLGRNHLSPILAELSRRHPGLELWLELVDRRVDLIEEGFDIDLRTGEVEEPHLIAHPIVPNVRLLCAAPSYLARKGTPRTLAELSQHECLLLRDHRQAFGEWRLHGPRGLESVQVTGPMGSNHSDIVHNWALAGHGVTLLASWDVQEALRSGELVRILCEYRQSAPIWAVTVARAQHSAKLRVCLDFLISALRQGPHSLKTLTH
jgi:LysR family transcriptional activator of dmlA